MRTLISSLVGAILLASFTALGSGLISAVYEETKVPIAKAERAAEAKQLLEIFPQSSHDNELIDDGFVIAANDALLALREPGTGYRARRGNAVSGIIIPATARDGYSGDIRLLVGINSDGMIAGVRILGHRETPGLGDKIELRKSNWVLSFNDKTLSNPTPTSWAVTKDGGEFDAFTGATVTPRAVVAAVRKALEYSNNNRDALFEIAEANES
ncbi:MAG: electron transport complex subunit RsxG [Luminiphilus sp.]|nr:electron transport complex subunit RsxG [Pseudomonadales bacterium]MBL6900883.1 electron transport complex subunit RsxG [Luminiphilus sp.]MDA0891878.1 electron transport complex subunit RsxG [Pseudomonadota bacterium]